MKRTYQIECGSIRGVVEASHQGVAFRKLMNDKGNGWLKKDWGTLVRFREVIVGHGFKIFRISGKDGLWKYQNPKNLLTT